MIFRGNLFLLVIFILLILATSCGRDYKKELPENKALKKEVCNKLTELLEREDSVFNFSELGYQNIDTILLFPAYTTIDQIKSDINDLSIPEYENKEFLKENEGIIVFIRDDEPLYYFSFDSVFLLADMDNNSYSTHSTIRIMPFVRSNGSKGAYLAPKGN